MAKSDDVKARVRRLLSDNGISENRLAAGDAATQKRLNRQISQNAALTVETILLVLEACPGVTADWLLRGTAPAAINTPINGNGSGVNAVNNDTDVINRFLSIIEEKDRQIAQLIAKL